MKSDHNGTSEKSVHRGGRYDMFRSPLSQLKNHRDVLADFLHPKKGENGIPLVLCLQRVFTWANFSYHIVNKSIKCDFSGGS